MFLSNFYKADFHVHTPESHCFYPTSEAKEEDYKKLLRSVKENSVDILAITDHNTINGYKYLLQIKEKYAHELETITKYSLKSESTKEVDEFISLFSEILILPGIEYEAKPGIHLLMIFNPEIEIREIDDFLDKAGITPDMKGYDGKGCGRWHVEEALDQASTLDAIAIGAHADRDKGIYNDTKHGYRQQLFRNENLHGLEFRNLVNREKIKSLLKDPSYQRKYALAWISTEGDSPKDLAPQP